MDKDRVIPVFLAPAAQRAKALTISPALHPVLRLGKLWLVWAVLLAGCLQLPPAYAEEETYEMGRAAYLKGDFAEAQRIWEHLAEQGDVQSQFFLGVLYDQGPEPIGKDDVQATHWFEKAARQGHVNAQFNLGNAYMNGRGVAQDDEKAVYWWRQAANNGSPNAQFNLGIQYYQGRGVDKDWEKATVYFNRAADNGHAKALELIASNQVPRLENANDIALEASASADVPEPVSPAPENVEGDSGQAAQQERRPAPQRQQAVEWLHEQNPAYYTVQLAVSGNVEGIDRLITRYNLGTDAVRVPVLRDGKKLYYLLLGSFADRQQASQRIESLAAGLRASKPWPRPFAELQALARSSP